MWPRIILYSHLFIKDVLFQNEGVKFVQFIYNNTIYDEYQLRGLKNGHTRIEVRLFVCDLCLSVSQFKSFTGETFLSRANFLRPGALSPCRLRDWFLPIGQLTWAHGHGLKRSKTNGLVLLQIRSPSLSFFSSKETQLTLCWIKGMLS